MSEVYNTLNEGQKRTYNILKDIMCIKYMSPATAITHFNMYCTENNIQQTYALLTPAALVELQKYYDEVVLGNITMPAIPAPMASIVTDVITCSANTVLSVSTPTPEPEADISVVVCIECGESHLITETHALSDEYYYSSSGYRAAASRNGVTAYICNSCYNDTRSCEDCGRLMHSDARESINDDYYVCPRCRDNYTTCDECGYVVHEDGLHYDEMNDRSLCDSCYRDSVSIRSIHNYSYKPAPRFLGDGIHFGIELEIEAEDNGSYDNDSTAENITELCENNIYCKEDGSLSSGFEIVSHPMTYTYFARDSKYKKMCEVLSDAGYRSHDTRTCGIHIHIERACLTNDQIAKIVSFFNGCKTEIEKIGRRKYNKYCRAHSVRRGGTLTIKKALEKTLHYDAVSLQPRNTIEIRVFKGTLNYETLRATLLFVVSVVEWTKVCRYGETKKWSNYAKWVTSTLASFDDRQILIKYLKSRGVKNV